LNVLDVELDDERITSPFSPENPVAEGPDDFGGLLIALGWCLPVGLMCWFLAWCVL
jgi:hypothetical protein